MKFIAINGSPRKNWNTAILLKKALEGAQSVGAETELVHLYDLNFKGCTSCFACKLIGGSSYGRCAMNDELTPVLKRIEEEADAFVLGTPIYFGTMSGEMRSCFERLLFAPLQYSLPPKSLFPRQIKTGILYTMNAPEELSKQLGYEAVIKGSESQLQRVFGHAEAFCSYDTSQFPDYSNVVMEFFDPKKKAARREDVFPVDCQNAFDFGRRLVAKGEAL